MGVGGGWEAEGGLNHPLAQGKSRCVFNKAQKQPQTNVQLMDNLPGTDHDSIEYYVSILQNH